MMRQLTAAVSGKVQMTGYRSRVVTIARVLGLKGYVRNLPDGRVLIQAEGQEEDLERFLKAAKIENTMIYVREIKSEFTDANGAFEDIFKVSGENETDARIDVAADYLKELIVAVKDGFGVVATKLSAMDGRLKDISDKQDETIAEVKGGNSQLSTISAKQDSIIDAIDESRQDVVSEVQGMRSDLKDRLEERLQRIEGDVQEIKARMRSE